MCFLSIGLPAILGTTFGTLATTIGSSIATTIGVGTSAAATLGTAAIVAGDVAITSALVGGAFGVVSGIQEATAQKQAALFQAEQAEENARLERRSSEQLELQANQKRASLLREMQSTVGTARTEYAAGGVVLGTGTSVEYEADARNAYDLDLKNFNYDVASQRWQKEVSAVNYENQASMYRTAAQNYQSTGAVTALGGVMKTIGNTLDTTSRYSEKLMKFAKPNLS